MNLLRTISILCFLGIVTNCKFPKKDIASPPVPQLDSLFVEIPARGEMLMGEALADSLVNIYINKADKFPPFPVLNSSFGSYKAYQGGFYQLNKHAYGKIISFEPNENGYASTQLFIESDKGDILDAIELAYLYGEEGTNGIGSSYVIRADKRIKVFTKKYWIVYEYYMPDERADTDLELDTFLIHEIQQQLIVPILIDSSTNIQMQRMFKKH